MAAAATEWHAVRRMCKQPAGAPHSQMGADRRHHGSARRGDDTSALTVRAHDWQGGSCRPRPRQSMPRQCGRNELSRYRPDCVSESDCKFKSEQQDLPTRQTPFTVEAVSLSQMHGQSPAGCTGDIVSIIQGQRLRLCICRVVPCSNVITTLSLRIPAALLQLLSVGSSPVVGSSHYAVLIH